MKFIGQHTQILGIIISYSLYFQLIRTMKRTASPEGTPDHSEEPPSKKPHLEAQPSTTPIPAELPTIVVSPHDAFYGPDARIDLDVRLSKATADNVHQALSWLLCDDALNPRWLFVRNKPLMSQLVWIIVDQMPGSSRRFFPKAGWKASPSMCRVPLEKCTTLSDLLLCRDPNSKTDSHSHANSSSKANVNSAHSPLVVTPLDRTLHLGAANDENAAVHAMDLEFHEATHMPILEPLVEQFDPTSYAHPVPTSMCEHFCACRETMNGTHNLLFLDCEMVDTAAGKALARLSVLSATRATLLDVYVMPDAAVTDYLTPYSGITAALLAAKADHTLQSARAALLALMHPRTVVAGHALQNDLTVLGLACAHVRILDTCKLYPTETPQTRSHSLKHLVRVYLDRDIQGSHGHDSVEDALAVRGLVALKAHRGVDYGVPKAKRRIPLLAKRVGGDRVRAFVPQSIAASMRAWIGPHVAAYDSDRGVMDAVQLHAKLAAAAPSSQDSSSGSNSNNASNPGSSRNVVVGIVSSAYFESREVFRTRMDELYSVLPVNGVLAVTVINPVTREEGVFLLGCKV